MRVFCFSFFKCRPLTVLHGPFFENCCFKEINANLLCVHLIIKEKMCSFSKFKRFTASCIFSRRDTRYVLIQFWFQYWQREPTPYVYIEDLYILVTFHCISVENSNNVGTHEWKRSPKPPQYNHVRQSRHLAQVLPFTKCYIESIKLYYYWIVTNYALFSSMHFLVHKWSFPNLFKLLWNMWPKKGTWKPNRGIRN